MDTEPDFRTNLNDPYPLPYFDPQRLNSYSFDGNFDNMDIDFVFTAEPNDSLVSFHPPNLPAFNQGNSSSAVRGSAPFLTGPESLISYSGDDPTEGM